MQKKPFFVSYFSEFLLAILLALSCTMAAFSTGGFILNFREIGFSVLSTAQKGIGVVVHAAKNSVAAVSELSKLHKEYDLLVEKLKDYEYMQRTNMEIRKENARLKEQLEFSRSLDNKNYPANIISRGSDNLYTVLVVDKGSRHGIKKNMPAIAIQNGSVGIVGKVVSVSYTTAQIMPLFDFNCTISARIQNTRDIGLVSGNGSDMLPLDLDYIKKHVIDELHFGDVVVTSGENDNYPSDIPIGTISSTRVLDYDNSLAIEISPIIDFSRLETVIVVDQGRSNDKFKEEGGDD